ncbi:hypothetical protein, partial [Pseudomonas putida]
RVGLRSSPKTCLLGLNGYTEAPEWERFALQRRASLLATSSLLTTTGLLATLTPLATPSPAPENPPQALRQSALLIIKIPLMPIHQRLR